MRISRNISINTTTGDMVLETDYSQGFRTFIVAYLLLLIIAGSIGNTFIILAFICVKKLRSNVNYFLVSLSCSDLTHLLLLMPLEAETVLNGERWEHSTALCEFHITMYLNVLSSSVICLLLLALYRFISVQFPYLGAAQKPWNIKIVITLAWVYTLITSSLPVLGWNDGPSFIEEGQCFVRLTRKWNMFFSICNFFIPAFLTLLLYVFIYLIARKHAHVIHKNETRFSSMSEPGQGSNKTQQKRRKIFRCSKTMLKITAIYLVCWMPFVLLTFIYAVTFSQPPPLSRYVHSILLMLAYTNSMLDPFLYAIWCSDFKGVLRGVIQSFKP